MFSSDSSTAAFLFKQEEEVDDEQEASMSSSFNNKKFQSSKATNRDLAEFFVFVCFFALRADMLCDFLDLDLDYNYAMCDECNIEIVGVLKHYPNSESWLQILLKCACLFEDIDFYETIFDC